MNKKEKYIVMSIIIISLIVFTTIFIVLKKEQNTEDNIKVLNSIKIKSVSGENILELDLSGLHLKFIEDDNEIEICFEDEGKEVCDRQLYSYDNEKYVIEESDVVSFSGEFYMSYEDDYILMKQIVDDNSYVIYYFMETVG